MKTISIILSLIFVFTSCGGENQSTKVSSSTIQEQEKDMINTGDESEKQEDLPNIPPKAPSFSEASLDFRHEYDLKKSLAFMGGTVIDIDGDGKDEFFITGGLGQKDGLFEWNNGKSVNITEDSGINSTLDSYGSYAVDLDNDTKTDLLVARVDGIYFYKNTGNKKFSEKKLDITLKQNAVPIDMALGDIDNDGDSDIYISTFITPTLFRSAVFNDPSHVQSNVLLLNEGNLNFRDVTQEYSVELQQNTFVSSFADLNNDRLLDLVVATNTDRVHIYKNMGESFELQDHPSDYAFWMGLAIADIDNDGLQDIFISNVGNTIPKNLLIGDSNTSQTITADYALLRNNGDFSFEEKGSDLALGFGWGITATDFNLDNNTDFIINQNYIKWPVHKFSKLPGSILLGDGGFGFSDVLGEYSLDNKNFGFSTLVGDFNGDNLDDIVYLNLDGEAKLHIREVEDNNKYLKIILPESMKIEHAQLSLELEDGTIIKKTVLPNQGIMTKQASQVIFGLNATESTAKKLTISYLDLTQEEYQIQKNQKVINLRK